ncbi:Crp/Fnr family transcriptional regulator [Aquabacterium sp.]|uniref:Crp/Fnr family transcriptional regulator n=1 Tax=Aquabacterium sp. TaxID=1872578 RepID=UPI0035AE27D1
MPPRSVILTARDWGKFYRLQTGMVRLDVPAADGMQLAGLLLPGDLIGAELLVTDVYSFTATALVPCTLQPCLPNSSPTYQSELMQSWLTMLRRQVNVLSLRQGGAAQRVSRLMELCRESARLSLVEPGEAFHLPTLNQISDLCALTIETACRVLSGLRRSGELQDLDQRLCIFRQGLDTDARAGDSAARHQAVA